MNYPCILNSLKGYSGADIYVQNNKDKAVLQLSKYYPQCNSMASLNGIVGGKNANYNANPMNYSSHIDFYLAWKQGHYQKYLKDLQVPWHRTSKSLYEVLEDSFLEEFISVYLSRTYFRKKGIK